MVPVRVLVQPSPSWVPLRAGVTEAHSELRATPTQSYSAHPLLLFKSKRCPVIDLAKEVHFLHDPETLGREGTGTSA